LPGGIFDCRKRQACNGIADHPTLLITGLFSWGILWDFVENCGDFWPDFGSILAQFWLDFDTILKSYAQERGLCITCCVFYCYYNKISLFLRLVNYITINGS
jgi:hypothetical protein